MKRIATLLVLMMISSVAFSQLIINEVLYDPSNNGLDGDANGDGVYDQEDDTFIEFVNTGTKNFDISGYQIWDDTISGGLKFVFPANTLVPPNGAVVVFGSGPLVGTFGNALLFSADTTMPSHLNFNNSGEVIVIKNAIGQTVLTFDSDALSNNPNESYTRFPDITGNFIQHGDTTNVLFSPGTRTDGTPFDTNLVVDDLTVQAVGGATAITTNGGTLQMQAIVTPSNAADTTVTWTLNPATPFATISASGLLTAVANGSVWVIATANDGAGATDSIEITITNQAFTIEEDLAAQFVIYPNPTAGMLEISSELNIERITLTDVAGNIVLESTEAKNNLDLSGFAAGVYMLSIESNRGILQKKIIKK